MQSNIKYFSGFTINNENDLLLFLLNYHGEPFMPVYPKIKKIARNIDVSPDIDILSINGELTIGYEAKYINFHNKYKRYMYESIYQGIGQALLYLNYGIDEVYLTIAYKNYDLPQDKIETMRNKIIDVKHVISDLGIYKYLGFEIIEVYSNYFSYRTMIKPILNLDFDENDTEFNKGVEMGFSMEKRLPDSHEYRKQCLLNKEFSYDKTLSKQWITLRKYNDPSEILQNSNK